VARRKESAYELDLVLRNNRRDGANPTGIFHPASDVHAIKRENIGVIEVMGLAILPARLKDELVWIQTHLKGGHLTDSQLENLKKHAPMMTRLERGRQQSSQSLEKQIQDEVGRLFLKGLEDAGVFKQTEQGLEAFKRFMSTLGWQKGAYPYAD
jgi:UDPglucose--hexose-1-phosphate uridylyltransferase